MRAIGFALVLIGGVVIFLSVQGKLGSAVSAFITGKVPSNTSQSQQEKAFQQKQTDNFYNNSPLERGNLPPRTPKEA
jgi:hypothetical protein